MNCPDTNELIDILQTPRHVDPALRWHVKTCKVCRRELRILRDVKAALLGKDVVVPDGLNDRVLASIWATEEPDPPATAPASGRALLAASTLGAATAASAMLVAGTLGQGGLMPTVAVILFAGVATGLGDWLQAARLE